MDGGVCNDSTDWETVYTNSSQLKAVDGSVKPLSKQNKAVWNAISQVDASRVCRLQYTNDIHSDLVNGYAWDTALIFICLCSDANYYKFYIDYNSWENPSKTGTPNDEKCKINNIASNIFEWSTEVGDGYVEEPAVTRARNLGAFNRDFRAADESDLWLGFRSILYF